MFFVRLIALIFAVSCLLAATLALSGPAVARDDALPLPRFVSLKSSEVNLRTGPGTRYPIEWVYQRRALPVEITAEFDNWRRVRDSEGVVGWIQRRIDLRIDFGSLTLVRLAHRHCARTRAIVSPRSESQCARHVSCRAGGAGGNYIVRWHLVPRGP